MCQALHQAAEIQWWVHMVPGLQDFQFSGKRYTAQNYVWFEHTKMVHDSKVLSNKGGKLVWHTRDDLPDEEIT